MDIFKIFGGRPSPRDVAKDRLKLILIHDRGDFSPDLLENIKEEILAVLSKYIDVDNGDVEVKLTRTDAADGNAPALVANIPIKNVRSR